MLENNIDTIETMSAEEEKEYLEFMKLNENAIENGIDYENGYKINDR